LVFGICLLVLFVCSWLKADGRWLPTVPVLKKIRNFTTPTHQTKGGIHEICRIFMEAFG
jgi:hypothetical protein